MFVLGVALRLPAGSSHEPKCDGLENRYPSLGGLRVQIPLPPFPEPNPIRAIEFYDLARLLPASAQGAPGPPGGAELEGRLPSACRRPTRVAGTGALLGSAARRRPG